MLDAVGYLINPVSSDEMKACIELGYLVHRRREELVLNLDWHRMQLDASIARFDSLQSEVNAIQDRALLLEEQLSTAASITERTREAPFIADQI